MGRILDRHIEIVEQVNNSKDQREHNYNETYLHGFREALILMDIHQIIECDWHYLEQGIDRPMCGGVFLDWQEQSDG